MNSIGKTISEMFGLPPDWHVSMAPQGTVEWLEARKGCVTGSRAKDACDFSDGLTDQQRTYVSAVLAGKTEAEAMQAAGYKASPRAEAVVKAIAGTLVEVPSSIALTYARDTALGRVCPAWERDVYQTAVMRQGQEQEAFARRAYEARTGYMVDAAGFICTPDRKIGVSIDGLVYDEPGQRGGIEVKTLLGANPLFEVLVDGDISAYVHQCHLNTWAWNLNWIDLCLWAPDLPVEDARLTVIRIERDQDFIDDMLLKLVRFERLVEKCVQQLQDFQAGVKADTADTPPGVDAAPAPVEPRADTPTKPAAAAPATTKPAELADADF